MNVETANHLQMLRKKNGYSQEELAEKIGISRQAVSKWERAEASPDTDNLILLAKLYGVTLDELLKTDSLPMPDSEGISLRKEDYMGQSSVPDDDGEIYPNGHPFNKAQQNTDSSANTADIHNDNTQNAQNDTGVAGIVKGIAGITKQAIDTTAKALNEANNDIENGKSFEKSMEDSFKKNFEGFGKTMEKSFENFDKDFEKFDKDFEKDFENFDKSFEEGFARAAENLKAEGERVKENKEKQVKYPATLLDKLFPLIIVCAFFMFGAIGLWHPAWLLFLLIPIYYTWVNPMRRFQHGDISFLQAFKKFLDGSVPIAVTFIFLVLGLLTRQWQIMWTIFFFIPIYYTGMEAIKKRNPLVFAYPVLVAWFYCTVGCFFMRPSVWVFMLPVFVTIPFYYIILDHIRKNKKK